eukprot:4569517-Alexandrium_andersonii.AAC.1
MVAAVLGIFGCEGNMPPAQEALARANVTWPMQDAVSMVNGNPSTLAHWLRPTRQEAQPAHHVQAVQRAIE